MGKPVKGDVVVILFPFSDFSTGKRRPALVVADLKGDDIILTQITTSRRADDYSISLTQSDFQSGGIWQNSNIRPNRLFTVDSKIITKVAGRLSQGKTNEVINKIVEIVKS